MRIVSWTLAALFAVGCIISAPVDAQKADAKAYAPEDLRALNINEQARVLNKQYFDMSNGLTLPEDQLEFYIDQIRSSNWSFSEISDEMAESLRIRSGPGEGLPSTTPGWDNDYPLLGGSIECASVKGRYAECATGFRFAPRMSQQLSRAPCVEGANWGHRPGMVWVEGGCRARFVQGSAPVVVAGRGVTCESARNGYRECRVPFTGQASLTRQLSGSACFEGQTWGQRPGVVWVDRGCRGVFNEGYRSSAGFFRPDAFDDITQECTSIRSSYVLCSWDDRYGRPFLIEQYSIAPCIEGRTWGHSPRRGLWVDAGCRARFGAASR